MSETIFWFRRDLRVRDNAGLYQALKSGTPVRPVFIFDKDILSALKNPRDKRVPFIYQRVLALQNKLRSFGTELEVYFGRPIEIYRQILSSGRVRKVICNHDYEPQALARDLKVSELCQQLSIEFVTAKDHVIFERSEILTDSQKPYLVYTPYKKKWLSGLSDFYLREYPTEKYAHNFYKSETRQIIPNIKELGFIDSDLQYPEMKLSFDMLSLYKVKRDFPALEATSLLGVHLRFGTVSVRELLRRALGKSEVWVSELIWRDFFTQILSHFPEVVNRSFREEFERVPWRESAEDLDRWIHGRTGYPLVDAGMRELAATGYMHNRVRMVVASFLTKHLLMHWKVGERYFARELLDYDLASNNGNWQWAAGTGCDAAPYFRIFNPQTQFEKFDSQGIYVRKWIPEYGTSAYPSPMVEHRYARERALAAFSIGLKGKTK